MVRRRARTAKVAEIVTVDNRIGVDQQQTILNGSDAVAAAIAGGNLLEDQYFASPKRKDCRMANANENLKAADIVAIVCEEPKNNHSKTKYANVTTGRPKSDRGGISGRNIGIPLATRSQTRTIENFFKANAVAKNANMTFNKASEEQKTIPLNTQLLPHLQILSTETNSTSTTPESFADDDDDADIEDDEELLPDEYDADHEPTPSPPQFVLNGEDTNDAAYNAHEVNNCKSAIQKSNGFATLADFEIHRSSTLRDSHSSHGSATDNIFLQEPVLRLDIDKSPNQASSIKINKSFEVGAIFSSPPGSLSACLLNGRFNQIVTLNGNGNSPTKRDSFGYECHSAMSAVAAAATAAPLNGFVIEQDSSSCDSGVAFSANSLTPNAGTASNAASPSISASRRRKPATPHRILCPSPIKTMPRHEPMRSGVSPGARKIADAVASAALKDSLSPRKIQRQMTVGTCKSRRRLNQPREQAPYNTAANVAVNLTNDVTQKCNGQELAIVNDDTNDDDILSDVKLHSNLIHENADDEEFEYTVNTKSNMMAQLNGHTKSILNSAKHPTARQNTTNNNHSNSNAMNNKNNAKQQNKTHANPSKSSKGAKPKAHATVMTAATTKTPQSQQLPLAATNGNRELTEFFPVRRSVRKTKTVVKEEMARNLEQAVLEERAEGLKIAYFEGKGRGVIADRHFKRGEFVIEYIGDLISIQDAADREKRYALDENAGCYMYYFKHKNQQYCIDATVDTGKFGRLVNHSRNGNLVTKVVVVKQRPHLVLLAKEEIEPGEELTYDYGDRSKEALLHHPWLAF